MKGLFVTGTGTEVGKTVAAACLVKALGADYWKPVQSGYLEMDDTEEVRRLTNCAIHEPGYRLEAPLSPHEAARLEGMSLDMDRFVLPETEGPLVVEGAGGLLVPINDEALMIDLIAALGLPTVIVSLSGLGTINHTLLSLEALRSRGLAVLGVVMNGPLNPANRKAIEAYGRVRVLGELTPADPLDAAAVSSMATTLDISVEDL